jgi:murein DD-endopeptidase MepM/ murein hydrolase activator NlpD
MVDLAKMNRLLAPYRLRIGQRLLVPVPGNVSAGEGNAGLKPPPTLMTFAPPELNSVTHSWVWPVDGPLSSLYGLRRSGWHGGIDIKADAATPVKVVADGTVTASEWAKGYGRFVRVEHGEGLTTVYAHNLRNFVDVGHPVTAGQVIGTVGRSGRATSPHLHFEVWLNGKLVNPLFVLPPTGSREIMTPEVDEEEDEEE